MTDYSKLKDEDLETEIKERSQTIIQLQEEQLELNREQNRRKAQRDLDELNEQRQVLEKQLSG